MLWSLLCSGKRGSKGSCEVKLLTLQPQEGPPPPVHSLLTLLLLVLSVFLAGWECFLATLIWVAQRERVSAPHSTGWRWAIQHLCPSIGARTRDSEADPRGKGTGGSHLCCFSGASRHPQGLQRQRSVSWHTLNWGHSAPSTRNPMKLAK